MRNILPFLTLVCLLLTLPAQAAEDQSVTFLLLLNAYRASQGVAPVALDPTLQEVALDRADQILLNYPANVNHNTFGTTLTTYGYGGGAGEVICCLGGSYFTVQDVFNSWKGSPSHNAILLNPGYTYLGIAKACSGPQPPGVAGSVCTWVGILGDRPGPLVGPTPIATGTARPVTRSADLNGDGTVDIRDYSLFALHFGERGQGVVGDLNGDGVVDVVDLSIFGAAFGK